MFVYKSTEEIDKMSPAEYDAYLTEKEAHEAEQRKAEIDKAIEEAQKNNATKSDIDALTNKQAELIKEIERLTLRVKRGFSSNDEPQKSALVTELETAKETLKSVAKNQSSDEVVVKAVTNRASVTNNQRGLFLNTIGQLGVKARSLYDKLTKIPVAKGTHNGTIRYIDWDEATTVRAAAMVAEGAAFPESTAKFQEYFLPLRKIGDTLPVTEEFFEDMEMAAAELNNFIDVNVNSKVDDQIVNGDNTGQNLKGLVVSSPTFTAVASGISAPNIKDLIIKMRTAITFGRGSKYQPDMVVMNNNTYDRLILEKDANDNYLFEDGMSIGMIEFVIDNNMPDNQLIVGDSRFAKIYEMDGVVISSGEVNAQFTSDLMTIKGRKRLALLVRNVDATGFLLSEDVTADLATLAL